MQHEILHSAPLLNAEGDVAEPGWARRPLPVYDRSQIKAGRMRIKEWDYYLVTDGRIGLALTIADNGYMGLDSISLLNFEEGWEITASPIRLLPMGRTGLPASSETGDSRITGKDYGLHFLHNPDGSRTLLAQMRRFGPEGSLTARVDLTDPPQERMVIATPFDKPGHFYYNQKVNCLRASGTVTYGYDNRTYAFSPDSAFAVLDWGRGVWTYRNTWYWGSASGLLDGVPFGWNIGYGFGDTSAASENVLFYGGRVHKLGAVRFHIPLTEKGREDYLQPWLFSSDDGRFEMSFAPVLDRASKTSLGVIESDQHQVFGRFTGKAVLDDGTALEVRDFFGFAEKVKNKW